MQTLPTLIKKYLAPLCLFTLIMVTSQTMAYPTQVTVTNVPHWGSGDITIYGYEDPSHWTSCGHTVELKPGQSAILRCPKGAPIKMLTDESMSYYQAKGCKTEDLKKYDVKQQPVSADVTPHLLGFTCHLVT